MKRLGTMSAAVSFSIKYVMIWTTASSMSSAISNGALQENGRFWIPLRASAC
jgi:hypothetical protein